MRLTPSKLLQVAVTTLTTVTLAHAADIIKPNIKPGLWEVTSSPQMSGQIPVPEEELAKMTPEQRARMEAAMKSYMANSAKPHVHKECMTPEKIARGFDIDRRGADSSCIRKVVSSSSSELTLHDECNNNNQKTVSDVHFEVNSGTQMSGKINIVMTSPSGRTMKVNSTLQGKWLGASCGSVKDGEVEK
jgi:hypothetical protein